MTAPQERPVAGGGLDREAVRRRCPHGCAAWPKPCSYCEGYLDALEAAGAEVKRHREANLVRAVLSYDGVDQAITDAINAEGFDLVPWQVAQKAVESAAATEARLAESVPRSALVQVHPYRKEGHAIGCWFRSGGPCDCTARDKPVYVLRTEGGASRPPLPEPCQPTMNLLHDERSGRATEGGAS